MHLVKGDLIHLLSMCSTQLLMILNKENYPFKNIRSTLMSGILRIQFYIPL